MSTSAAADDVVQGQVWLACLWQQLLLMVVVVVVAVKVVIVVEVVVVVEELEVWGWSFSEAVWGSAEGL